MDVKTTALSLVSIDDMNNTALFESGFTDIFRGRERRAAQYYSLILVIQLDRSRENQVRGHRVAALISSL